MVNILGSDDEFGQGFCEAGLPFFETAERAVHTYAKVLNYQTWQKQAG